LFKKTKG